MLEIIGEENGIVEDGVNKRKNFKMLIFNCEGIIKMDYKFKYFLNPEKNASYVDEPCEVCGSSDLCLDGTYFDNQEELESICMECLVKGKVVVEFPSFLYDKIYYELKRIKPTLTEEEIKYNVNDIFSELEKTPPVPWLQYNDWPVCCGDFMTYLGELTRNELNSMAVDGDGKTLLLSLIDDEMKNRIDSLEALWDDLGDHVIAYHFKCMECDKQIAILQSY